MLKLDELEVGDFKRGIYIGVVEKTMKQEEITGVVM